MEACEDIRACGLGACILCQKRCGRQFTRGFQGHPSSHEAVLRRLCWSTISWCAVCQPQDLQLSSLQACVGSSLLSQVTTSSTEIQHSMTRFCLNRMWICSAMIPHCLALWVVGNGRMLSFSDLQKNLPSDGGETQRSFTVSSGNAGRMLTPCLHLEQFVSEAHTLESGVSRVGQAFPTHWAEGSQMMALAIVTRGVHGRASIQT